MSKETNLEYKKLNFKENINVIFWTIKFLFKLQKARIILDFILSTIRRNQNIVYTFIFAKIIDEVIKISSQQNTSYDFFYILFGLIVLYFLFTNAINYFIDINDNALNNQLPLDIETELTKKIMSLDINKLEDKEIADKIERAKKSQGYIQRIYNEIIGFITTLFGIIISGFLLINFLPYIIIPLVTIIIIRTYIIKRIQDIIYKFRYEETENRRINSSNNSVVQNVKSLKELKLSASEKHLYKKYYKYFNNYFSKHISLINLRSRYITIFAYIRDSILLGGAFVIFKRALKGIITLGDITFQIQILRNFTSEIQMFNNNYIKLLDSSFRASEYREVLLIENDNNNEDIDIKNLTLGPAIEINNLSFKYDSADKDTLKDIDLKINPGEKVAIVGHNGAGKTTLIKLISKIYNYDRGSILLNDMPLNRITKNSFYNNLAVLFQDFNKYGHLSVKENITIGDIYKKKDNSFVIEVAKKSDAFEFIQNYTNKFNQILNPALTNGTEPSQGEWQKIAISRFFYRDAPLVIFDEPTAAIDAVSEYNIFNRIYKFFKGKTVILISHRFSTVRNADKIFVMDKGKIVEVGNHKELMEINGIYAHSFNLQAEGYKD